MTSIKSSCGPFPCQCHHQPVWLWMSVKALILFCLFIAHQPALPGPPDNIAFRIETPYHTVCLRLCVGKARFIEHIIGHFPLLTECKRLSISLKHIQIQTALCICSGCCVCLQAHCFGMQNCHLVVSELRCSALIKSCYTEAGAVSVSSRTCSGPWWFQGPEG